MKRLSAMLVAFCFVASVCFAQEGPVRLKIAAGSSSGIYEQFLKEIQQQVSSIVVLEPVPSHNATENFDNLVGNNVNLAFMHSDVLFYNASLQDLSHIKTLLALFPEDVNIVTLNRPYKLPKKNIMDLNPRTVNIETISDLSGLPIGTAGGGFITTNVIKAQGGIDWEIIRFDNGAQALAALREGNVAAVVLVGAAPIPAFKDLGPDYKLVTVNDSVADRLKQVYRRDTITYNSISSLPVQTIAADCLLVTRNYKSQKNITALLKLRQAVYTALDDLKETTGYHKAWQKVEPNMKGKWPGWFTGTQDVEEKVEE